MRDNKRTNEQTLKIELLSQWKLEAEFRNSNQECRPAPRQVCEQMQRGMQCHQVTNCKL